MPAIRILSDRVANQIAAGEVVERPASIVKELVENSLDAGATRIEVEFHHGGRSFIRVEDDGCGMSRDDALLCLERHATSKIREATDLDHVRTFGFRGEAMPSIASVSRFTLQSRDAASENGTEILVNGGKIVHVRDCGMPVGTRITVSHLFNSVPARRKFLKSDATEAAHLIHHTRLYALASPQVSFTLIEDGRTIFRSPVCATLEERVAEVFGRQVATELIPIDAKEDALTLRGLISRPGVARSTRHEMITFVNRRPVDSRTLAYALLESYHTLIPKGRYPIAFVFLDLDPAAVDVNVHPAKREVRFRDESRVRGFTIRTVLAALRGGARTEDGGAKPEVEARPASSSPAPAASSAPARSEPSAAPSSSVDHLAPAAQPRALPSAARPLPPASSAARPSPAATSRVAAWRQLSALDGGYSLFEGHGGSLIVLDRRAASERVWFERLLAQYRAGRVETQRLLLPLPLELDPVSSATLSDSLAHLRAHGVEIEPFGRDFFRIEGVPAFLAPGEAEVFVRDVLGLLRGGQAGGRGTAMSDEELARAAAARASVAAAGPMAAPALEALVVDLLRCHTPHTSPAGRPTFIEITPGELLRRFHKAPSSSQPDLGPSR
ncbi:MAG: DNA mismatch repair endonuclease MutL [Opitutaceae bacterium]|nr:DNA mismatch repair endonuclease MutL [Opitutaceae bacterium]